MQRKGLRHKYLLMRLRDPLQPSPDTLPHTRQMRWSGKGYGWACAGRLVQAIGTARRDSVPRTDKFSGDTPGTISTNRAY